MAPRLKSRATHPDALRTIAPNLSLFVMRKLSAYVEIKRADGTEALVQALRNLQRLWSAEAWSLELRAVALVIADLIEQGWLVTPTEDEIRLQPPGIRVFGESTGESKDRLRAALQKGRERQLREPSVSAFVQRMQRRVLRPQGRTSVVDLIDDGKDLRELLVAALAQLDAGNPDALKSVIDPEIEVCDENLKCQVTGLRLIDIWRYFRHTWSLEYRSMPGRQLPLLIRNAARSNRPVIGIAMLASPVLRSGVRDRWIGWTVESLCERVRSGQWQEDDVLKLLKARIDKSIREIRSDDLLKPEELRRPTDRLILRLEQQCAGAAAVRQRELESVYSAAVEDSEPVRSQRGSCKDPDESFDWYSASSDPLFIRKRAGTLAKLLAAKKIFREFEDADGASVWVDSLLTHPSGRASLETALQEIRKAGLSSQMADVSVCGAIEPYSHLLGGKLVALLMASKETLNTYRRRYEQQVSLISSQMAGRPIRRAAGLKVLTTTSLYGSGSSQYNRLRLLATEHPELAYDIRWTELPVTTAGYGSVHLGTETVRVLRQIAESNYQARRINHRFGEGASPRLRQIRESLEALGIDSNAVLHHATPRIMYGCEIHPHAIEQLLGLRKSKGNDATPISAIASAWRQRWLVQRARNPEVMARLEQSGASSILAQFEAYAGPQIADVVESGKPGDLLDEVKESSDSGGVAA